MLKSRPVAKGQGHKNGTDTKSNKNMNFTFTSGKNSILEAQRRYKRASSNVLSVVLGSLVAFRKAFFLCHQSAFSATMPEFLLNNLLDIETRFTQKVIWEYTTRFHTGLAQGPAPKVSHFLAAFWS